MFEDIEIFISLLVAVVLEAIPFLLLGSFLGSVLEVYVSQDRIARFVPQGKVKGTLFGLSAGFILPTCECGVVPIVMRLLSKGVKPHVAITYMLAAPSINPIVLASTYVAFRGSMWMVLGRVFLSVVPALAIGYAVSRLDSRAILRPKSPNLDVLAHDHGCGCATCCAPGETLQSRGARMGAVLTHTATEFLEMGKYLILGALAAALFKIFLPFRVFLLLENNIFLGVGAMMLMAVLLSICSEADAFVAASFASFPAMAKLSFISLGPMVDLKLMAMYSAVFNRRFVAVLVVVPSVVIYLLSVFLGLYLE